MMKQIETKGDTIDLAVNKALAQLGKLRDDVSVEIVQKPKSGFLGIGKEAAVVRVTYQTSPTDTARDFLDGLLLRLGVPATVIATEDEQERSIKIEVSGDNMGMVIGRRGDTLDALQYLASIIANRDEEEHWHLTVDTENYRTKREASLQSLAVKMAQKAVKYKKSVALEPMKPHERRIIHSALQEYKGVNTYSVGNEPHRKVIVAPKEAEGQAPAKPQGSGSGSGSGGRRRRSSGRRPGGQKPQSPQTEE